ncbi:MAG: hypothetical protein R3F43_26825 [bacterium]
MLLQALQPFLGGGPRAPTVANSPLGLPQRLEPGDNAAVERALREVVARRWFDEAQLPASLSEDLDELDGLRQPKWSPGDGAGPGGGRPGGAQGRPGPPGSSSCRTRRVQLEASLAEGLVPGPAGRRGGQRPLRPGSRQDILDGLVAQGAGHQERGGAGRAGPRPPRSPGGPDRVGRAADAITARRRRLGMQYANLTRRQARVSAERAALESELVLERARILTEREQLAARRMALRVDLDDLERAQARSLAQTAVDLAVAVGYR